MRYFFIVIGLICLHHGYATHVRAGDLTARTVSSDGLTYEIRVILYRDTDGIEGKPSAINPGDGTPPITVFPASIGVINNRTTEILVYQTTHTFASAGRYNISFLELTRNEGVANMVNSVDNGFYIESMIFVNPLLGANASPLLLIPPVDVATTGQRFIHNAGAFDSDGDSLSYRITICKRNKDTPVQSYRFPDDASFSRQREDGSTPPLFTINSKTGDLIWDAPSLTGEYNVAFIVDEFRDGILIGSVNRDMQILVADGDNRRPRLVIPGDTCLEAGKTLNATISATDPDNDRLILSAVGDLFNPLGHSNQANFSSNPLIQAPATGFFSWNTNCGDIRLRPYQVVFRASDSRTRPILVDIKTWQIQVVGPAPRNLTATLTNSNPTIDLKWASYTCPQADKMTIWRKRNGFNFKAEHCQTGLPNFTGYTRIAEVPINQLNYTDTKGLELGTTYCYRLVASFPFPKLGQSYASQEVCVLVPGNTPFITNVDVVKTDNTAGEIQVRWTSPYFINSVDWPPPYTYRLIRSEGLQPSNFQNVTGIIPDTSFLDVGLNTRQNPYNYGVMLFSQGNLVDTSAIASSVFLTGSGDVNQFKLAWEAEVPWSISTAAFPYHYISRKIGDDFRIIDSVLVGEQGLRYNDTNNGLGFRIGQFYDYKIQTTGAYPAVARIGKPLINHSQILTIEPTDTIPPCPVSAAAIDSFSNISCGDLTQEVTFSDPCNTLTVSNRLTWSYQSVTTCTSNDAIQFRIYRQTRPDAEKVLIDSLPISARSYLHNNLSSAAGCYTIVAVDRSGNESRNNTVLCVDNCTFYKLPNSFTPADDKSPNNTFKAFRCPRFVRSVQFTVFNKWGQKVYESSDNIDLNWDGQDSKNRDLPAGVYYYRAEVKFIRLRSQDEKKVLRGWIKLFR